MPPRIRQAVALPLREASRPALRTVSPLRPFTCSSCLSQQEPLDHLPSSTQAQLQPRNERSQHAASQHPGPVPQRRLPRWAATPERMRAPVSLHQNLPANRYNVNESPERLDRAYNNVFGPEGPDLLTAEVKWLAVTHKSFDQGRRGYNDRLAYLGKRIVDLQTSLALLAQPDLPEIPRTSKDGREPFRHPAMDILTKLSRELRQDHTRQLRIAGLAMDFGLQGVVRWKPRVVADLNKSGLHFVLAQALYAMVGALALQKGGDVAVKAVRSRILPALGLKI